MQLVPKSPFVPLTTYASELSGFDIEVAVDIAEKLGVELLCNAGMDMITGGSWANRWISALSMTFLRSDGKAYFTQPYYTTPAHFLFMSNKTYYITAI
jgi:polar amino acid transport system substrate-binding protein